ncbi:LicD family protein [Olsenella profusa]|uniref:LicD family protein n=1 Tax=Olsenella profusa TaxID=138595 RepID=A0ABS2F1I2_9ACTN|nr:LicD family protein [Olsenella profusa]MBM6774815.1 LicD family protein [Olsenella profusa]
MRRIPVEDIHPLLLGILEAFSSYCAEWGLSYFLDYGTLLGAVRHHGFIPWDDDVDVSMMRDDYERLVALAHKDPYIDADRRYRILLPMELPNFYPFIKVVDERTLAYERNIRREYGLGVWLDVFCMSYCPPDDRETARLFSRHNRLKQMNKMLVCGDIVDEGYKKVYPVARLGAAVLRVFGFTTERCMGEILDMLEGMPRVGKRIAQLSWPDNMEKDSYPAEWWNKTEQVEFEGRLFSAPAMYHEILMQHYGDYMALPPESERVRHGFEAYYLEG